MISYLASARMETDGYSFDFRSMRAANLDLSSMLQDGEKNRLSKTDLMVLRPISPSQPAFPWLVINLQVLDGGDTPPPKKAKFHFESPGRKTPIVDGDHQITGIASNENSPLTRSCSFELESNLFVAKAHLVWAGVLTSLRRESVFSL